MPAAGGLRLLKTPVGAIDQKEIVVYIIKPGEKHLQAKCQYLSKNHLKRYEMRSSRIGLGHLSFAGHDDSIRPNRDMNTKNHDT